MKDVEHEAFMEEMEKRKRSIMIFIALLLVAFVSYYFLVRPLLRAYL